MKLQLIWLSPPSQPQLLNLQRTLISRAAHPCPPALIPTVPGDKEPGQHGATELLKSPQPQLLLLTHSSGLQIETETLNSLGKHPLALLEFGS